LPGALFGVRNFRSAVLHSKPTGLAGKPSLRVEAVQTRAFGELVNEFVTGVELTQDFIAIAFAAVMHEIGQVFWCIQMSCGQRGEVL
jgi:hypothetical protein